jgi:hypothetical protein
MGRDKLRARAGVIVIGRGREADHKLRTAGLRGSQMTALSNRLTGNRRSLPARDSGRRGSAQWFTVMAFSTESAPGADQAVDPARHRAFHVVTFPVSLICPPSALT